MCQEQEKIAGTASHELWVSGTASCRDCRRGLLSQGSMKKMEMCIGNCSIYLEVEDVRLEREMWIETAEGMREHSRNIWTIAGAGSVNWNCQGHERKARNVNWNCWGHDATFKQCKLKLPRAWKNIQEMCDRPPEREKLPRTWGDIQGMCEWSPERGM